MSCKIWSHNEQGSGTTPSQTPNGTSSGYCEYKSMQYTGVNVVEKTVLSVLKRCSAWAGCE